MGRPWTTPCQQFGEPRNEIGYRIERADVVSNTIGAFAVIGTALANQVTFTDTACRPNPVLQLQGHRLQRGW